MNPVPNGGPVLKGFEYFVAKRYLVTRKKTGFISLISLLSVAGIAVGVAALIIVLSLLNGFSGELRTTLLGMDGHVWVSTPMNQGMADWQDALDKLNGIKGVTGTSPYCSFQKWFGKISTVAGSAAGSPGGKDQ